MAPGAVSDQSNAAQLAERSHLGSADRALDILRGIGPLLTGTVLPFALVLYLALRGGGYDVIVRNEVGLAVLWVVLLGAMVGALPLVALNRPARWALGLLAGLAAWTVLSLLWTESIENGFEEFVRTGIYVGVLALALGLQGREGLRRTVNAVGAAIAVVAALAVLSRLHSSWFPANELAQSTGELSRLSYPLNYWNGVAAFVAIGLPLVTAIAVGARHLLSRALATAAIPVMALAIFYTYSRSGAAIALLGVGAFVALSTNRIRILPTLAVGALGTFLVIVAATQRDALRDGLLSDLALQQGDEMIAVVLATAAGVALLTVAFVLARRYQVGPRPSLRIARSRIPALSRAQKLGLASVLVGALAIAAIAGGAGSTVADRWEEFKDSGAAGDSTARFQDVSGNGRYQYWQAAIDAFESEPILGIGSGSYEYWWLREGSLGGPIRDAHSLYFETLGELGVVGLALVLGLLGLVVVRGVRLTRRDRSADNDLLGGAVAAAIVFAVGAGNDWLWEITVIPVTFLLIAAAILQRGSGDGTRPDVPRGLTWKSRLAVAAVALTVLAGVLVSLLGAQALRGSQEAASSGDFETALAEARSAQDAQPYAATPLLQEALLLFDRRDLDGAIVPARLSTEKEPTNWRTWYAVWQIEIERYNRIASTDGTTEALAARQQQATLVDDAYERVAALNPRSGSFASAVTQSGQ